MADNEDLSTHPLYQISERNPDGPAREIVFRELRKAILTGYYKPGAKLVERELAAITGVSRTPIREAIRMLQAEGLVESAAFGGVTVIGIGDADISEIFGIRKALEGLAAWSAAKLATPELIEQLEQTVEVVYAGSTEENPLSFHLALTRLTGYKRLENLLDTYRGYAEAFRHLSVRMPGRREQALAEHRAICAAVAARAPDLARQLMEQHIELSYQTLLVRRHELIR